MSLLQMLAVNYSQLSDFFLIGINTISVERQSLVAFGQLLLFDDFAVLCFFGFVVKY